MPLKFPPLPRLSPYPAPSLASNRCFLSVASMRSRAPCRVYSLEVARGTLRGAHSPAGRALRAFPAAPAREPLARPLCREFAPAWPCRDCRGVVPLLLPLLPPLRQPWRPAPAGFTRSPLPRVKRARRVQKPAGKGEGAAGGKGPRH